MNTDLYKVLAFGMFTFYIQLLSAQLEMPNTCDHTNRSSYIIL